MKNSNDDIRSQRWNGKQFQEWFYKWVRLEIAQIMHLGDLHEERSNSRRRKNANFSIFWFSLRDTPSCMCTKSVRCMHKGYQATGTRLFSAITDARRQCKSQPNRSAWQWARARPPPAQTKAKDKWEAKGSRLPRLRACRGESGPIVLLFQTCELWHCRAVGVKQTQFKQVMVWNGPQALIDFSVRYVCSSVSQPGIYCM